MRARVGDESGTACRASTLAATAGTRLIKRTRGSACIPSGAPDDPIGAYCGEGAMGHWVCM